MDEPDAPQDAPQIEVQNIDHPEIVAGIIDEIGLVEEIDHLLGTHSQEHVSAGQALKAMILNGLGFVSAPLYLFEQFFYGKATEHLIAPGIRPGHLNDDRLGRVLDKLFEADPSQIFINVALRAARHFGVCTESVHLDATSLHLHGHHAHDNQEAKTLLEELDEESFISESAPEGYRLAEARSDYGGVEQRWIVVQSSERHKAQNERLQKKLEESDEQLERRLRRLRRQRFSCQADARKALQNFAKDLGRYHLLTENEIIPVRSYQKPGRPSKDAQPEIVGYRLQANLAHDEQAITKARGRSGRFILATNVLDDELFSKEVLVREYKGQHTVERGFRFLKDPMFFTSSVFVKSPKRVATIALVMGLCLLVYALGERVLRLALEKEGTTVRHQTGKLTDRPTLRWVFQIFQAVHLLSVDGTKRIANLTEERERILSFLLPGCRRYYLLQSE